MKQIAALSFPSSAGKVARSHGDKWLGWGVESAKPKEAVNLRLDADVLEYFRNTGPGLADPHQPEGAGDSELRTVISISL